jgi:hypothetical protein
VPDQHTPDPRMLHGDVADVYRKHHAHLLNVLRAQVITTQAIREDGRSATRSSKRRSVRVTSRPPRRGPVTFVCSVVVPTWGIAVMPFLADVPVNYLVYGVLLAAMAGPIAGPRLPLLLIVSGLLVPPLVVIEAKAGGDVGNVAADAFFLLTFLALGVMSVALLEAAHPRELLNERRLDEERARSDRLLHNILPVEIAARP